MKFVFKNILSGIAVWSMWFGMCWGQSLSISVKDANGPLPGAVVHFMKLKDSSFVSNITNQSGVVKFDAKLNHHYAIKISYLGFKTLHDTLTLKTDHQKAEYRLQEDAITIGAATITAQRPLMRQEDDKIIVDPMPLINSSTNTLEMLEKVPGLYVDQDGSIYLSSTMSATIYINGSELKMDNEDIATMLRSLPPNSVERIEVLRTPSTKFDASSTGGIINIVLKKGVKIGLTGSVNVGMNQGFYGNRFAGFSLNNSGTKTTSYLNINYNHNDLREVTHNMRSLVADTALHQTVVSRQQSEQGYLGYGINFDATKRISLSYDGRVNASFPKSFTENNSQVQNSLDSLLFENNNQTNNKSDFLNIQQDLGVKRKFDTLGSELDTKLNYSFNSNNLKQDYVSAYTYPFVTDIKGNGTNRQQRHYIVFQSDLTYLLPHKYKLETGIKSSYQLYTSESKYFIDQSGTPVNDSLRTNEFNYQENINAAYAQASKTFGKWFTLKAGVRLEHTYMKGHQIIPADTNFLINRVDLFPYVYLSRELPKIFGIKLSAYVIYRRTITRPDYQSLNPYIKVFDDFLYETGNPALKPQFTDNYEFNISFNDMPILAFGQNFTKDIFSNVIYRDAAHNNVAIRTFDNLGRNRETYFRLMVGIPPGKRYFFALGAQYNYSNYKGVYMNEDFAYKRGSWRFFTFHSLSLFKQTKITLSGFMMINGQMNFYELKNFGSLNMSLTQTLFHKHLSITLSARDLLHTMLTRFQMEQQGMIITGDRYTDNQRFGINIRYSFGRKNKDDNKGFGEQPEGEF